MFKNSTLWKCVIKSPKTLPLNILNLFTIGQIKQHNVLQPKWEVWRFKLLNSTMTSSWRKWMISCLFCFNLIPRSSQDCVTKLIGFCHSPPSRMSIYLWDETFILFDIFCLNIFGLYERFQPYLTIVCSISS